MHYFEQLPPPGLRPFVDKLWYCQAGHFANRTLTLPLLHHELVFNFSDYFGIFRKAGGDPLLPNTSAWISGLQTSPTVSVSSGKHEMMGVLFKPQGLAAFTGYPAAEFENHFADAAWVFGDSLQGLLERLQVAPQPIQKLKRIAEYLTCHLRAPDMAPYVAGSMELFKAGSGNRHSVKEVCRQIGVTNKTLIQSFQKHVGITPARYMQLQSVNQALASLARHPQQRLTELAHQLHFFDQSHFIHSFKTFTGLTPTQYAHYAAGSRVDSTSPNFILCEG